MSAPKPKVRRVPADWPAWQWACGDVESRRWPDWESAQSEADRHSRTHTAERVAELLEHMARNNLRPATSHSSMKLAKKYRLGRGAGMNEAADLIREHLVKEAT